MDVLAVTDFPDIRVKCAISSASQGNILIIPREGGYLVRFYIELDEVGDKKYDAVLSRARVKAAQAPALVIHFRPQKDRAYEYWGE